MKYFQKIPKIARVVLFIVITSFALKVSECIFHILYFGQVCYGNFIEYTVVVSIVTVLNLPLYYAGLRASWLFAVSGLIWALGILAFRSSGSSNKSHSFFSHDQFLVRNGEVTDFGMELMVVDAIAKGAVIITFFIILRIIENRNIKNRESDTVQYQ